MQTNDFLVFLAECLQVIDDDLGAEGVALNLRPTRAAFSFVQRHIISVTDQSVQRDIEESYNFLSERWFAELFKEVEAWYRQRYGAALKGSSKKTSTGFVVLWRTAFRLEVPLVVSKVEKVGETAWLSIPSSILPAEEPLSWLTAPPVLSNLTSSKRAKFERATREVTTLLRSINAAVMGTLRQHDPEDSFVPMIQHHLEEAAKSIVDDVQPKIAPACWNLQMACEFALKAVLHRKTGTYLRTHNLYDLHALAVQHAPKLKRAWIKQLPDHKRMNELRYGTVEGPAVDDFAKMYLATLHIVNSLVQQIATIGLGKASFLIACAPWIKPTESNPNTLTL